MKKVFILFLLFSSVMYAQSIILTTPNGGESLEKNSYYDITWTATGLTNAVKITLWKDGEFVGLIVKDQSKTGGSYRWRVSDYQGGTADSGEGYTIKIREQGGVSFTTQDDSNSSFNISEVSISFPNRASRWTLGLRNQIKWESRGFRNNLKLTLWKDGTFVGLIVKDLDPSSGSYPWVTGVYQGGTASVGSGYVIKAREQGGASFITKAESESFSITVIEGRLIARRDFELKSIYFTDAAGGKIVARIKNNINQYSGNISLSYKILPSGVEKTVTKRVRMSAGSEKVIVLISKTREELGCKGVALRVKLDPTNLIQETNERNNQLFKTVYATAEHDGKITYVNIIIGGRTYRVRNGDNIDLPNGSNISVGVAVHIGVLNCGGTRLRGASLEVIQNLQSVSRDRRGHCRSFNESIGFKNNISLSSGISRRISIPVRLHFNIARHCRTTKNEITVNFKCGENSARNRNNIFKFSIH